MSSRFRRPTSLVGRAVALALVAGTLAPPAAATGPRPSSLAALDGPAAAPAASGAGLAPAPTGDGAAIDLGLDVDPSASAAAAGLEPSVQAEEAERHANDRIDFQPGGRVADGYRPAPGDRWTVDGTAPTALPGGRLDGKAIRSQGRAPVEVPHRPRRTRAAVTPDALDAAFDRPAATPASDGAQELAAYAGPSTQTTALGPDAAVNPDGLRREIFGFLPYWELNASSLRLDYAKISTIAYFGVGVDTAGNLQKRNGDGSTSVGWSGWTSSKLTSVISTAHRNHTRVVLTVQSFGWTTTTLARQKALLASSTARLNLARQIAAAVRDRGADGVNLDFEPLAAGAESQFTALVRTIRAELNRIHKGYQITFDTTGSIGNYPIEAATASGGADAIFVMGYDYRTGGSSPVGSVAPYDRAGYGIRDTVLAYTSRVPASKVILGVPYYGRAWSTGSNLLNASNQSSTKTGASTTVVYDTAADYLAQYGRRWDPVEKVAWTAYRRQNCTATYGCVTAWRELYLDDAAAISAKYDLVNAYGLRGAGIWALGYDGSRPELYAAIQRKFITDTTPPVVGITTQPARQTNPEFWVAWHGWDDVGIVSYDVQRSVDGGAWATWLSGTTQTRVAYDGDDGHTYAFRVRARDRKGNTSAWNVTTTTAAAAPLGSGAFALVRTDGLAVRSSADTSATKLGTLSAGDIVAVVGGPRTADGYTWVQITGPLTEWRAVRATFSGRWVAASSASGAFLTATKPPNATTVRAMLGDLAFGGAGAASVGTGATALRARSFSPNGDGSRDGLALAWTNGVALDGLALHVFRADGTSVGTVPLDDLAAGDHSASWNGRVGGIRLPDGRYVVSLVGTAGSARYYNPIVVWRASALAPYGVTIDTVPPVVTSAAATGSLVSPNGDGILDSVKVAIAGTGATSWAFGVARVTGSTVGAPLLVRSGGGAHVSVTWGGTAADGSVVPDGTYRLQLVLLDAAGNHTSRTWTVRVDRTPATLGATAPASFSPNGDGAFDTARLAWTSSEPITGTLRVLHGTTVVRSWTVANASAGAATWNGTTSTGAAVADGTYTVRITGRDAAGNPAAASATVRVDRTLSSLRLGVSPFFPMDGDALSARSPISVRLARPAVVTGGIYAGSKLVRSFWSKTSFGAGIHGWTWDGRTSAGAFVPPGVYVVKVSATSALGTTTLTRSVLVDAFVVSTSATTLRAGQTLTVTLTTVEPLKYAPNVTFTQPGRAGVRRTATSLGGGRYRVAFTVAAGGAGTATITIAGRDTAGGLNIGTRRVTIQ